MEDDDREEEERGDKMDVLDEAGNPSRSSSSSSRGDERVMQESNGRQGNMADTQTEGYNDTQVRTDSTKNENLLSASRPNTAISTNKQQTII